MIEMERRGWRCYITAEAHCAGRAPTPGLHYSRSAGVRGVNPRPTEVSPQRTAAVFTRARSIAATIYKPHAFALLAAPGKPCVVPNTRRASTQVVKKKSTQT